jgi:hypothetical protein
MTQAEIFHDFMRAVSEDDLKTRKASLFTTNTITSARRMDRNIGSEHAWPSDFWSVAVEPSPSVRSEPTASLSLSRGEALILVLSLSFGLWAAIWGAVALLAMGRQ